MAGTTLVIILIEEVPSFIQISKQEFEPIWVRIIRLTKSRFISLAPSVGTLSVSRFEEVVPINFYIQMESNQDSAALAQQIQALAATVEELTRQNQEMNNGDDESREI